MSSLQVSKDKQANPSTVIFHATNADVGPPHARPPDATSIQAEQQKFVSSSLPPCLIPSELVAQRAGATRNIEIQESISQAQLEEVRIAQELILAKHLQEESHVNHPPKGKRRRARNKGMQSTAIEPNQHEYDEAIALNIKLIQELRDKGLGHLI